MYTLGIDLHKHTSMWVAIDDELRVAWSADVKCHPDNITTAIRKIERQGIPLGDLPVALEPVCGWRWVAKELEEAGMKIHIANPLKVRIIAESAKKTDFNDARFLAELLAKRYLPEAYRLSDEKYEMRSIIRYRRFLVGQRTNVKNRMHGIATANGLHLILGGNPLHKRGAESIKENGCSELKDMLDFIGKHDEHIDPLEKLVATAARKNEQSKLLMTMPGIGPVTALTVLAEVGDFSRFSHPRKLCMFAGLVPSTRNSAGKVRHGRITKAGSPLLREVLAEAAMRIRASSAPELYGFYERIKIHATAKQARVALAHKMLSIMWYMIAQKKPYSAHPVSSSQGNTKRDELVSTHGA